jgi:hypothetical protein
MKEQTAVEWLEEKIKLAKPDFKFDSLIREAKTKEKEQLLSFAKLYDDDLSEGKIRSREDLYRKTYGK